MKKIISSLLFISFLLVGCYKTDPAVLELLKQIQGQNDALRLQVAAMQKTTDSLAIVFKANTNAIGAMDKKIDSIRSQLSVVLSQLNALNTQLSLANANIADIQLKIAELQKTCDQLLWMLNQCCNTVPASLQNGLVAYYPFTGNANDSSGNGFHGTVFGAILSSDRFGKSSSAYLFSSANSSCIKSNIGLQDTLTISAWFKSPTPTTYYPLIWNFGTPTERYCGMIVGTHPIYLANGDLGKFNPFVEKSGSTWSAAYNLVVADNTWHHIAVSYVPGDKFYLYIDGRFCSSLAIPMTAIPTGELTIGRDRDNAAGGLKDAGCFNGIIDEVKVWNRKLTQDEISYISTH